MIKIMYFMYEFDERCSELIVRLTMDQHFAPIVHTRHIDDKV